MTPQQMRRRFFVVLAFSTLLMLAVGGKLLKDEIARIEVKKAEFRRAMGG